MIETAVVQVRPDADPRVEALYQEGVELHRYAAAQVILTDDDAKAVADHLSLIAGVLKRIEKSRQEYTRPLNEHLRTVNGAFKAFVGPLNQANALLREKVLYFRAEQERARAEQERINRLREEAARAEMELRGEIAEPVGLVAVSPGPRGGYHGQTADLGAVKRWEFEVVDFGRLPDDYKLPDMVKIRKIITSGATIPGVQAQQVDTLRVTARQ